MQQLSNPKIIALRHLLVVICLLPFVYLLLAGLLARLGPNPVESITHSTGVWALRLLLLTLMISPLQRRTKWRWLMRLRRTLALSAFFYAALHVLAYLLFEQSFGREDILNDLKRRPFVMAGWLCFILMLPLASTSTNAMMKRLGRNWQRLHRLAYVAAMAAVLHYFWLVKQDTTAPASYAVLLAVLFCLRLSTAPRRAATLSALPGSHCVARPGSVRKAE